MHPQLKQALQTGVYPMTRRIAIGQFATRERSAVLQSHGVTHVLNVGEAPSILTGAAASVRSDRLQPVESSRTS